METAYLILFLNAMTENVNAIPMVFHRSVRTEDGNRWMPANLMRFAIKKPANVF